MESCLALVLIHPCYNNLGTLYVDVVEAVKVRFSLQTQLIAAVVHSYPSRKLDRNERWLLLWLVVRLFIFLRRLLQLMLPIWCYFLTWKRYQWSVWDPRCGFWLLYYFDSYFVVKSFTWISPHHLGRAETLLAWFSRLVLIIWFSTYLWGGLLFLRWISLWLVHLIVLSFLFYHE